MGLADDIRDLATLGPDFDDIIDQVKRLNQSLSAGDAVTKDQISNIRSIGKEYSNLYKEVERVIEGTAKTAQLNDRAAKLQGRSNELIAKRNQLITASRTATGQISKDLQNQAKLVQDAAIAAQAQADQFRKLAAFNDQLNSKTAFFDNVGGLLSGIPGLEKVGQSFNTISKTIRKVAVGTGDVSKGIEAGLKAAADIIAKLLVVQLFAVEKEITEFSRQLNISRVEATKLKFEFTGIAASSFDVAINSVNIAKSNALINKELGTAAVFSGEILRTTTRLTEKLKLSAESAASLAVQAVASGASLRETEENALSASYALQRSTGIALNNRDILEATGKVTGQVRANLGANPELIAEAVTKAKLLGLELNNIAATADALLDFESSISSELEAELLTGKQLNLERARSLALQGDLAGLADEITAQGITFTEFNDMNVLQQRAIAKSLGLSADTLADSLLKQQAQNMTRKELIALGGEELANRAEQLSAQEKLAAATQQFTVFLGEVVTILSPIAQLVGFIAEVFSTIPGKIALTIVAVAKLLPLLKSGFLMTAATTVMNAFGGLPPPFNIIAGVATLAAVAAGVAKVSGLLPADDFMSGPVGRSRVLTAPEGSFALNDRDTILAGTDLGGGGGGGNNNPLNEDRFVSKLAGAINNKKVEFDPYTASGPSAMAATDARRGNTTIKF
jgi:hypothetical protein